MIIKKEILNKSSYIKNSGETVQEYHRAHALLLLNKGKSKNELAEDYKRSTRWIQKQIFEYEPEIKIHKPRAIVLVCDATFYGKRKDKLGTLVFKDNITKEILLSKHIESELSADYKQLLNQLLELGYTILSVTFDAKRGLYEVCI